PGRGPSAASDPSPGRPPDAPWGPGGGGGAKYLSLSTALRHVGVLRLEWRERKDPPPPWISRVGWADGALNVGIHTAWGRSCVVEASEDLSRWKLVVTVSPPSVGAQMSLPGLDGAGFHRLVDAP
ncbi:MAG: hypothetical protein AB7J34_17010, partial [Limisphaerales bacterium]